jgi:hypothetical protein
VKREACIVLQGGQDGQSSHRLAISVLEGPTFGRPDLPQGSITELFRSVGSALHGLELDVGLPDGQRSSRVPGRRSAH